MPFPALLTTGILFLLVMVLGVVAYAAATDARSLARRRYPGASDVARWNPMEGEGSMDSGASFVRFFFSSHRALGDVEIDRLCSRVRWAAAAQLALGVALVFVVDHAFA
jgi:hypothetical protein